MLITGFRPVVLTREKPLDGWFVAPELGGGQEINLLVCDLDETSPVARLWSMEAEQRRLGERYAFRVTETDVEYFELQVFTSDACVTWGIDILYEAGGGTGSIEVRDDRLRVTAESSSSIAFSDDVDGEWTEAAWGRGFGRRTADRCKNAADLLRRFSDAEDEL